MRNKRSSRHLPKYPFIKIYILRTALNNFLLKLLKPSVSITRYLNGYFFGTIDMKLTYLIVTIAMSLPLFANADQTFISTNDGKTLAIPVNFFDTPAAKEFLNTGKNPYMNNADAMKAGKKVYQLYSCAQCHGPIGNGQVGPNLRDDTFNYAKNATDKGMFETLWAGAPGGMGAKGKGLMLPDDPSQGLSVDEILKVSAFLRSKVDVAPVTVPVPAATPAATAEQAKETATAANAVAPAAVATDKPVKRTMQKQVKKLKKKA